MSPAPEIDVGSHLFLTAAPGLKAGDELSPGHWLSQISSWTLAGRGPDGSRTWEPDATHAFLELAWETVRLREFSPLPSRLDCLFLWADEAEARAWHYRKHVLNASSAGLYEAEVIACRRAFAGDMNLISYLNVGETVAVLLERARRYWRGEGSDLRSEVLLEGSVVVHQDLLALSIDALCLVKNPLIDRAMHEGVRWSGSGEATCSLRLFRTGRYHLKGLLAADTSLPISAAGWFAVEIEGQSEPILARRATSPALLRPGETCAVDVAFTDLPTLSAGARCRPVLICDRSAAHYWQLQSYWDGSLPGDWQAFSDGIPVK